MASSIGKAKGGTARAAKLTPERRKEIARGAVAARKAKSALPRLIKKGDDLNLGGIAIPCAVIEGKNGEPIRVLTEHGITNALLGSRSGASKRLKKKSEEGGAPLPLFIAPGQLKPFVDKHLGDGPLALIEYTDGDRIVRAYNAELLPAICEVWLEARQEGALQNQQLAKAQQAEILTRGLARVGIIALVDEATGYQKDRARDALAKILEAYVAKELQPYVRTFEPSYYEHMFRLRGLPYPPDGDTAKPQYRPQYFGKLTNDIVYSRLAPGVLQALKDEAKKESRKTHLHRHLTAGYGKLELIKHLAIVTLLMKRATDWQDFMLELNKEAPRYGDTVPLDLEATDR